MKKLGLLLAVLCIASAAPAAEEKIIDRIVAIVDKDIILESELQQYVQFTVGSEAALRALSAAELDTLRDRILTELIRQKVLLAKARLDSVTVEPRVVDSELDQRIKTLVDQAGGQDKLEAFYGMPLAKIKRHFRTMVEENLLIERVRQEKLKHVQTSTGDVLRFWEAYKDSLPPLKDGVHIAHILLVDSVSEVSQQAAIRKADSVRTLLMTGQVTFAEYASRYSDDPGSREKGGKLGQTNRGDLVPEYEAVAYALEPGQISAPVVTKFGVHLIRLNERVGEKINTDHILFRIVPTPEDLARTEARAESLIARARAGEDFGDLAKAYSADVKTASKGGDLGWFAPAELPEEFQEPLKNLRKGDIAPPLRTRFGLHIVKVLDRVFARPLTLEEDYDRIARLALAKKQEEVYNKWVSELAEETYIERK